MIKKSNKFILFLSILMMVMPFFIFNVGASDVVIEDFDSYAEGVQSGSNAYVSWSADLGITSTTEYFSSPMSLKVPFDMVATTSTEYINMTTNETVSAFEFWYYYSDLNDFGYTTISFINDTDDVFVRFKLNIFPGEDWEIYDYDNYAKLIDIPAVDTWFCLGFQGNRTVGNPINYIYYYIKNSTGSIIASVEKRWMSLQEFDPQQLSQITIVSYDNNANGMFAYLDDFTILDYTAPEYEGEFDFDSTDNIGNLDTTCTMPLDYKELEFRYQIPVSINATGFDLMVDSVMHYWDDDLSNYDLFINGESMGNPTEWKEYANNYVLRWVFPFEKVITNSMILYEVWHDVKIPLHYWNVGVGCNQVGMDGDLMTRFKYSNTYPNGAYDGTVMIYDIAYQIYYDTLTFIEDTVDITYDSITTVNTTYYVGDSVPLTYMIKTSNVIYDNYVRVWNDDTSIEIPISTHQGVPYLCKYQLETIGFVPFTSANYTAHLYVNGASVDNTSFFVDDRVNSSMYVFTYPNPSKVGEKMWVEYNYDHPTGKSGAIFLCISPNLNSYISVNYLSDGDNGFWTYTHDTSGKYYYIMAVDTTGNKTYGIVNNGIHPHTVTSEHGNNYFKLGAYNLRLNEEGTVTQSVRGESNMLTGNCFIYDNNKLVKTITDSPFFYSYDIYTAGLHTVEMRLTTNVTTVLFTQNYTVTTFTGEDELDQIEDTSYILHDWVYDMYGDIGLFMAGISVVLGFMFIPFALVLGVNVKFNKNIALGDLHWSTYLIFAIVGVIVDVQLHLAELWIILLVCVVSIAIAVISYTGNR